MAEKSPFSRRAFLKLMGINMLALTLPGWATGIGQANSYLFQRPWINIAEIPLKPRNILGKVPNMEIDPQGYLRLMNPDQASWEVFPCVQTLWNKEHSNRYDRLYGHVPWGIVLHWYGDKENFDKTIKGYVRGFDSLRKVATYITRTSAHFLVGPERPTQATINQATGISVLQTQMPDKDGTPFVGSHLMYLDYLSHEEKEQYFVRALNHLGRTKPFFRSLLQDLFEGPVMDPNMRTIAIEITGYDFESPEHYPGDQQIANVIGVVWAVMKRYGIPAMNILGHNEIKLGKPDPGKKFMAVIRYLLGLKALLEKDERMFSLVFGQFVLANPNPRQAVSDYFTFVREYLMLISIQRTVYEWESATNYWFTRDLLNEDVHPSNQAFVYSWPVPGIDSLHGDIFLDPDHHEGIDFYSASPRSTVNLIADGRCLFVGEQKAHREGRLAMFRHRQADGAEIVSVYSGLDQVMNIQVGERYALGYPVGVISRQEKYMDPFLHFAIAYGATWDTGSKTDPCPPLNAGTSWINYRYMNPYDYLSLHADKNRTVTTWQ